MKLLTSVDDMILSQDISFGLIASLGFYNCLMVSINLGEDRRLEELYLEFIEGLLMCVSTSKGNILCPVYEWACLSTTVDNKLTIVISKA